MPTVARFLMVPAFVAILPILAFIATEPSLADTITFEDLGDTISVVTTSTRFLSVSCGIESCSGTLVAPPGAILVPSGGVRIFNIAEPNVDPQHTSTAISDTLEEISSGLGDTTAIQVIFLSDSDSASLGFCTLGGITGNICQITENGNLQSIGSVLWGGNGLTTDNIDFRSDVTETPEPSSIILMFAVLAAFGMRLHKKVTNVTPDGAPEETSPQKPHPSQRTSQRCRSLR
jgi:hypothetical protein